MKLPLIALSLAAAVCTSRAAPDSFIWINVSIKCVVDPTTGVTPSTMSDSVLQQAFTDMNRWLANNYRGYRVRAVDTGSGGTFKRVGGLNDTTGPGKWYSTNLKPEEGQGEIDNLAFEDAAKANKTLYGWNDNAANIYFNNGDYSRARFPSSGRGLIISAYNLLQYDRPPGASFSQSYKVAGNLLHELGHWFELYHTFPDDGISDTAADPNNFCCGARNETDIRNKIAQANYSLNYSSLTAAQKTLVDNTANNVMAYIQLFYDDPNVTPAKVLTDAERFGPSRFLFTEEQIDKWTRYANVERVAATSGVTKFLDDNAAGGGAGTRTAPFNTLTAAINAAGTGDIVMALPGNYSTTATGILSKPGTIRATRLGGIVISKP